MIVAIKHKVYVKFKFLILSVYFPSSEENARLHCIDNFGCQRKLILFSYLLVRRVFVFRAVRALAWALCKNNSYVPLGNEAFRSTKVDFVAATQISGDKTHTTRHHTETAGVAPLSILSTGIVSRSSS